MCGIVGYTGKNKPGELLRLLSKIKHRGYDGQSFVKTKNARFGMNRLAIIDLSPNIYPMTYKQYQLVFNGEIYNYSEIKLLLEKRGVRFKTNSDAEVILPLYFHFGVEAFQLLEGMFAITIYDKKRNEVLLVRDKSGEKPLYYCIISKELYFSSEMKALLSLQGVSKKIDPKKFYEYFTHGFVKSPETLIRGIRKLPPSSYLIFKIPSHSLRIGTYWVMPKRHANSPKRKDSVEILDGLLYNAVKLRMIADVPIGCFLSGGLDSSLITLYASRQKAHLHTFSISFPGYESFDESQYSSFIANRLKTHHTQVSCTVDSVVNVIDKIGLLIDEPIVDPAFVPTLILAKEARKTVKVVLTGEGADELFAGYSRYATETNRESLHAVITSSELSKSLWKYIFKTSHTRILLPLHERYSPQHIWDTTDLKLLENKYSFFSQSEKMNVSITDTPLSYLQATDYRGYLVDQLLNKVDKATMSVNLEARAPYLDSEILNFANNLSDGEKIQNFNGKIILKHVAERYFPKRFIWRKKHGFDLPLSDWFKADLKPFVYESLDRVSHYKDLFSYEKYRSIVTEHMEGSKNHANKLWSMIVLTKWMERHHIQI